MENLPYTGRKMLVVLAHPDDETFGIGGTLALYGNLGAEIHLICATRGEVGEVEKEKLTGFDSIGDLREHELLCAAGKLHLTKVHFLGYRDSGMAGSPENDHPNAFVRAKTEQVGEKIAELMRRLKPDIVITFDPMGGYSHPDHIAAHQAAVLAFHLSSDKGFKTGSLAPYTPKKLYFHIMPRGFLRFVVCLMPLFKIDPAKFGKNKDIDLTAILTEDYPVHVRVNYRKFAKQRDRASACHASQGGDRQSGFIVTWLMRLFQPVEMFMQAVPPVQNKNIESDLFSGV